MLVELMIRPQYSQLLETQVCPIMSDFQFCIKTERIFSSHQIPQVSQDQPYSEAKEQDVVVYSWGWTAASEAAGKAGAYNNEQVCVPVQPHQTRLSQAVLAHSHTTPPALHLQWECRWLRHGPGGRPSTLSFCALNSVGFSHPACSYLSFSLLLPCLSVRSSVRLSSFPPSLRPSLSFDF